MEKQSVDDPGTFDITVKIKENGVVKPSVRENVIELLTVDHVISGNSVGLGLASSIEIVVNPLDPKYQRMIVLELQKKFGAVIGFTEKGKKEGRGCYRVGFMHLHEAAQAYEALSTLVNQPLLPDEDHLILHEVEHLKTWKD